jgi:hypothetical protein
LRRYVFWRHAFEQNRASARAGSSSIAQQAHLGRGGVYGLPVTRASLGLYSQSGLALELVANGSGRYSGGTIFPLFHTLHADCSDGGRDRVSGLGNVFCTLSEIRYPISGRTLPVLSVTFSFFC